MWICPKHGIAGKDIDIRPKCNSMGDVEWFCSECNESLKYFDYDRRRDALDLLIHILS